MSEKKIINWAIVSCWPSSICISPGDIEMAPKNINICVTLVDLAVYIFVRLVTRGRYAQCHSQFNNLSEF